MGDSARVLILGGFLGSGKTTVLLDLAEFVCGRSDKETSLAILENEIGQVDVDGSLINTTGYQVKSLLAGCACCELLGELPSAVGNILNELDPELLIIEATGIASPGNMADSLSYSMARPRVVVLADASRWLRIRMPLHDLLQKQVGAADIVLVNKCDLVDEDTVAEVVSDVKSMNDQVAVITGSAAAHLSEEQIKLLLGEE